MNSDRQARLPEYVGKKIVEALKQEEDEIKILDANTESQSFTTPIQQQYTAQMPTFEQPIQPQMSVNIQPEIFAEPKIDVSGIELPDNVMMLVNLINQLPAGVSKQVGAQIIKQTIEAMGIPMKSVLSEAQYIQEDLGNSMKDCASTIEEYKSNIRSLEQKITLYKKQAEKLGELINLFVMTIR